MTLAGAGPELTLHQSVKFVAGAYIVFLAIILLYVVIMAVRQRRTERDLLELRRDLEARAQLQDAAASSLDGGPGPSVSEAAAPR
ncbi:MAG: hypothetical protein ACLP0J_14830 [Solirubrobacteraceae bacterium]|jgi:hypothetical protein